MVTTTLRYDMGLASVVFVIIATIAGLAILDLCLSLLYEKLLAQHKAGQVGTVTVGVDWERQAVRLTTHGPTGTVQHQGRRLDVMTGRNGNDRPAASVIYLNLAADNGSSPRPPARSPREWLA